MARQVIQPGERRRGGSRDHHSRGIGDQRRRVVDLCALCLAWDNRTGKVGVSTGQFGDHLFTGNGNEHRMNRQVASLKLLVQYFFQLRPNSYIAPCIWLRLK